MTLTDDTGGSASGGLTVTAGNAPPAATFSNGGPAMEGGTATVSFANPFDPSATDTAAGFTYSFDFDNDRTFEVTGMRLPP